MSYALFLKPTTDTAMISLIGQAVGNHIPAHLKDAVEYKRVHRRLRRAHRGACTIELDDARLYVEVTAHRITRWLQRLGFDLDNLPSDGDQRELANDPDAVLRNIEIVIDSHNPNAESVTTMGELASIEPTSD